MQKEKQRKKENRAKSMLKAAASSARLSPPQSDHTPPAPDEQPQGSESARRSGKRKRSPQDSYSENGRVKRGRILTPRTSPREKTASPSEQATVPLEETASLGGLASTRTEERSLYTARNGDESFGVETSGESKEEDFPRTPPSPYPGGEGAGVPSYAIFTREDVYPMRINYEALGWIRDNGPSDKALISAEQQELQSTKPLSRVVEPKFWVS